MTKRKCPSVSVKDVNQQRFTKTFAAFLKRSGKVKVPDWTDLVKTGCYKELAPFDDDWFYTRVAAMARHIYIRSPVGVGAARKIFGGRVNRGSAPSHFVRGSGSIARKALQTLEALKLVEKAPNGGRRLTVQGHRDLDRIASQIKIRSKLGKMKSKLKGSKVKAAVKPKVAKPKTAAKKAAKPKAGDKAKDTKAKAPKAAKAAKPAAAKAAPKAAKAPAKPKAEKK